MKKKKLWHQCYEYKFIKLLYKPPYSFSTSKSERGNMGRREGEREGSKEGGREEEKIKEGKKERERLCISTIIEKKEWERKKNKNNKYVKMFKKMTWSTM